MLVLYGMGTTIGAGIYVLTGAVAGIAGLWAPISFLLAAVLAGFAALSLGELAARYPRAAGEAYYVRQGFGAPRLAGFVGIAVAVAGAISAATVARGFAAYVAAYSALPPWFFMIAIVAASGAVAARGIAETAWIAALLTVIEIGGLLIVIFVAGDSLMTIPERAPELLPPLTLSAWMSVLSASVICFYAFLGFEDMVNVAEEVQDVRRTLPLAILWTLVCTLVLYVILALVAVLAVPPAELAQSEAPLALIYQRKSGGMPWVLSAIGAIAMSNGALIQIVKSSRVLYGLADQGTLPRRFGRVHPRTRTPLFATGVVTVSVAALAIAFPLELLARMTSWITLGVFALICGALLRVRKREPAPDEVRVLPAWIPATGALVSFALLAFETGRWITSFD
jgi:APA family basic amino acid/polyamine antiporter